MLQSTIPTEVPRSTATNAYDLLDDVVATIEAEHKRLDMKGWFWPDHEIDQLFAEERIPACHTMACVGGWLVVLHEGKENVPNWDVGARAVRLLCPATLFTLEEERDTWARMRQDVEDLFNAFPPRHISPGTPEYVAHVVAAIRTFQSTWAPQLRARTF